MTQGNSVSICAKMIRDIWIEQSFPHLTTQIDLFCVVLSPGCYGKLVDVDFDCDARDECYDGVNRLFLIR